MKKSTPLLRTLLLIVVAFTSRTVFAQDTLSTIAVEVEGQGAPILKDAIKLEYNPQIDPPQLNPPTLTYTIEGKEYGTKPEIVPSKPQTYNVKDGERQAGNYTRIGYGMYNTPLFETYFHNTVSKRWDYGGSYKHLSGEYKPYNQIFADHHAEGHLAYHLSPLQKIYGAAGYERHRINWYGFDPDSAKLGADTTKNIYNKIYGKASYEQQAKNKDAFGYAVGLDYHFQNDRFFTIEHYFKVSGDVKKEIRKHPLTVPLAVTSTSFAHRDSAYSRLFIDIKPRYLLDFNRLVLNLGFNATVTHDSADNNLYFYPFVDFKIKIIDKKLNAHLGIDGMVMQNTYADLLRTNPFLDTVVNLHHSNMKNKAFAGFWGSIGDKTSFQLEADFGNYQNIPFYLGDTTALRKYKVIYDNIDIFNVKATVQYQMGEQFKAMLEASYHDYQPDDQKYYWNMPSIEGKLNLQYTYNNMFSAKVTTYYMGQRYGKNIEHRDTFGNAMDSAVISLPGFFDVNVGLEYRYNKMISVFLNASNLTNQAYQRWNNYPGYKMNILGGVTFTF